MKGDLQALVKINHRQQNNICDLPGNAGRLSVKRLKTFVNLSFAFKWFRKPLEALEQPLEFSPWPFKALRKSFETFSKAVKVVGKDC